MALPPWTQGIILYATTEPQTIYTELELDLVYTSKLFSGSNIGPITIDNEKMTFPTLFTDSNFFFEKDLKTESITINKSDYEKLLLKGLETSTKEKIWGTKTNPLSSPSTGAFFMGDGSNKLFFEYNADQFDEIIVINPLLFTCNAFLKDITGVNDIPGASITLMGQGGTATLYVVIENIPADPDGMCRGMLLFI